MTDKRIVCIVDDDDAVRDSISALLTVEGYVPKAFADATSFLDVCGAVKPVCIVLDVRLPDADGIDVLGRLSDNGFVAPVIIITGHGDVGMAVKAMRLGAMDFVEKPFDPAILVASVNEAAAAFARQTKAMIMADEAQARLASLSPREKQVMLKLAAGQPNKLIAHDLGLSPRTVEIHRARVMEKTAAKSLSHVVRLAIAAGVDLDSV